jgi:tetratricopeptide (TPR) repeat protein/2-polyprenyl-3-methyl-5-hydroxy-6-metoxy-1,4-benzoquinol methylase
MHLSIEHALQKAIEAHKAGNLQAAEILYRAILQVQPKHPDANHNLGVIALSLNKPELALPLFKTALEANLKHDQFWISYIDALVKANKLDIARGVLEQGQKLGLAGQRVEALEAQLASILATVIFDSVLPIKHSSLKNQRKQDSEIKERNGDSTSNQIRGPSQADTNSLLEHYLNSRYALAENLATTITNKYPDHQFSWKVLGAVFLKTGRLQESLVANQKSVAISPSDIEANYNLGLTLHQLGKLEDAEKSYRKAILIKQEYGEAHCNLGITLQELGRLEQAEASYRRAIAIKPEFAEAHYNLGNTLKEMGRLEQAEASYRRAIAIKPEFAEAYYNLGNTQKEMGILEEAEVSYRKAIAIKPEFIEALSNLSNSLRELGRVEDALVTVIKSINIKSTVEAKKIFVEITKQVDIQSWNQSLAQLSTNALIEPWGRPADLMPFSIRLLKNDKEFIQICNQLNDSVFTTNHTKSILNVISKKELNASSLLGAMLSSSPIPDIEIELFLTYLRRYFLNAVEDFILDKNSTEDIVAFYCSLAQQCFINDYVYFQTSEEIALSKQLHEQLTKALREEQFIPAVLIIIVACYFPLYSVAGAKQLLYLNWSQEVKSVLLQQIQEPLKEMTLQSSIPVLTEITNYVSISVQCQYEENPYPRWVRLPKESSKKPFNQYIKSKFPLSTFKILSDDKNIAILIAGCGTGQHSIETAQEIHGAKILAVDLSMKSLAYAKRKTIEFDIDSIEYAQADLLKLENLGSTFDVIESSGVLHHLENPFVGWEVLLSLLRPNGLMRLGFYSKLARADIVRVRNLITKVGTGSTSQEIRDYRKNLLGLDDSEDYGFATSSSDFFSTSACRDLLFHVQEHRMDLKLISDFLKDHNLNFLGFEIDSSVIRSYKNCFSNDPSATNLNQWQIYENDNPDTFRSMYQFWVQKQG